MLENYCKKLVMLKGNGFQFEKVMNLFKVYSILIRFDRLYLLDFFYLIYFLGFFFKY